VDWEEYANTALRSFAEATTPGELAAAHTAWLGRKSELKVGLRNVRDRETGMALNAVRERLEEAFAAREAELERAALAELDEQLDVTLPGTPLRRGRLHPLTQIRREVEDIFLGLGYEIVDSREVETVWHNFDALNQPLTHPSRSHRDTFYLDDETLLRTHTSTGQIRVMEEREPPIGEGREVRMRTSFFPFTEPSVEFDVTCFLCGGKGCAFCKHTGWFEMGGAGVVDPAVLSNVGYDPEEWSGFAWGLGLDRIAAQRHGIPDIRMFWENDLRVLRQF
jgi:phenylalanyl-tRNA synthetase alpha chain